MTDKQNIATESSPDNRINANWTLRAFENIENEKPSFARQNAHEMHLHTIRDKKKTNEPKFARIPQPTAGNTTKLVIKLQASEAPLAFDFASKISVPQQPLA